MQTKKIRRNKHLSPILSHLNYDFITDIMETMCNATGDLFTMKKVARNMKIDGRQISRYTSFLLNSGALSIFREIGNSSRAKSKVYQRNFCNDNIEDFMDIMFINEQEAFKTNN